MVDEVLTLTIFPSMECAPMKGLPNGHIPAKGSLLMASSRLEGWGDGGNDEQEGVMLFTGICS